MNFYVKIVFSYWCGGIAQSLRFVAHCARDSGGEVGISYLLQTVRELCDLHRMHSHHTHIN